MSREGQPRLFNQLLTINWLISLLSFNTILSFFFNFFENLFQDLFQIWRGNPFKDLKDILRNLLDYPPFYLLFRIFWCGDLKKKVLMDSSWILQRFFKFKILQNRWLNPKLFKLFVHTNPHATSHAIHFQSIICSCRGRIPKIILWR